MLKPHLKTLNHIKRLKHDLNKTTNKSTTNTKTYTTTSTNTKTKHKANTTIKTKHEHENDYKQQRVNKKLLWDTLG